MKGDDDAAKRPSILNPWTWAGRDLGSRPGFELQMQCPTTRNGQFEFFCPETLRASSQYFLMYLFFYVFLFLLRQI